MDYLFLRLVHIFQELLLDVCEACGSTCCKSYRIEVLSSDDIDWSMIYTTEDKRYWMRKKEDRMTCVALIDNRCSIYEKRPQTCRNYEVGEPRCLKLQIKN